ncbi:hypothetical protein [Caballeronia grimmiae]|uniref:hypothetical protein n=1 Tax=Caballeronia grimmiae TaxID=1071679 RepID=UPI0038BD7C28
MSLPRVLESSLARLLIRAGLSVEGTTMRNTAFYEAMSAARGLAPRQIEEVSDAVSARLQSDDVPAQLKTLIEGQARNVAHRVREALVAAPIPVTLDASQIAAIARAVAEDPCLRSVFDTAFAQHGGLAAPGDLTVGEYRRIAQILLKAFAVLADPEGSVSAKNERLVALRAEPEANECVELLRSKTMFADEFAQIFTPSGTRAELKERAEQLLHVFFLITERL